MLKNLIKDKELEQQEKKAVWNWNYNYGKPFPWPCKKCGALVEMEKIGYQNQIMFVRCPECGYEGQRND